MPMLIKFLFLAFDSVAKQIEQKMNGYRARRVKFHGLCQERGGGGRGVLAKSVLISAIFTFSFSIEVQDEKG